MANEPQEVWVSAPGLDGRYDVSSLGRVRAAGAPRKGARLGRVVKPRPRRNPRLSIYVSKEKIIQLLVCNLVCEAFHGAPPKGEYEVFYVDGDEANLRASNLAWRLRDHANVKQEGIRRKLTEEQVLSIRADTRAPSSIAIDFNISGSAVRQIKQFKIWKHI